MRKYRLRRDERIKFNDMAGMIIEKNSVLPGEPYGGEFVELRLDFNTNTGKACVTFGVEDIAVDEIENE